MFRFINSGLKQSVTTFPNSIHHINIHKRVNDDEVESKKSLISTKYDQTLCIYKRIPKNQISINLENYISLLEKRNLIFELEFHFNVRKSQKNSRINDLIINLSPYLLNDLIGTFYQNIPKFINESPIAAQSRSRQVSRHSKSRDKVKDTKRIDSNKKSAEETLSSLIEFGHELNTRGCKAVEKCDQATAVKYWNCAAMLNYPPAQFNLGAFYESRDDLLNAEKWYRSAVESGDHPTAAYNLALLLNNKSDDVFRDEIKTLLNLSAHQGFEEACKCIQMIEKHA